jgi:hypothetical protein
MNLYGYVNNDPGNATDPTGNYVDVVIEGASVGIGVASAADNFEQGNYEAAAIDAAGVIIDTVLTAVPFVPGAVGLGIQAARKAEKMADRARKTETHHIVPKHDPRAQGARDNMESNGIDPARDPSNQVELSGDKHDVTKRESYVKDTNQRIESQPDDLSIKSECCKIGQELKNSTLEQLNEKYPPKKPK